MLTAKSLVKPSNELGFFFAIFPLSPILPLNVLRLLLALLDASLSVLAGVSLSLLFLPRLAHLIWDKLCKVRGTYVPPPLSVLVTPTSIAGGYQDICDTLGRSFAFCSSDVHYTPTFLQVKSRAEASPPFP